MNQISWQSARKYLNHKLGGRLPLLSIRPTITFPVKEITTSPVRNYNVWWQRHTGVSNLPKATTQWYPVGTRTHNVWIASPLPCQ